MTHQGYAGMTQMTFFITLISVMTVTGVLGGVMNYHLNRKDDPDSSFWRSILLGVGASLLVPLFLNMISSNLMDLIRGNSTTSPDFSKILVFAGFCLVAAISSTVFIRTLSDRILTEVRQAKKAVREVKAELEPMRDAATEPPPAQETLAKPADQTPASTKAFTPVVTDNERKVLEALASKSWVFRTRTGVARDAALDKPEVDKMMDDLKRRGLVGSKTIINRIGEQKKRWYITNKGREAIL